MLIKASIYYGNRAPGWVALIHGQPWHFASKKEAQVALLRVAQ
jgi:hypothetical protein